jgi:hypothetical protein
MVRGLLLVAVVAAGCTFSRPADVLHPAPRSLDHPRQPRRRRLRRRHVHDRQQLLGPQRGRAFGALEVASFDAADLIEHNTIAQNSANPDMAGGIRCSGAGTARHNIVYGSQITTVEVIGCDHEFSLIGATTPQPGTGNIVAATIDELRFVNLGSNYHITPGSVAAARGASTDGAGRLGRDVDGDSRLSSMADLGADEIP